jgi:monoterpene epsilon-lactone hydrolase
MQRFHVYAGMSLGLGLALATAVWSQAPAANQRSIVINKDGSVTVKNAVVPLSSIMSEGSKKVLMRTKPTEGPGAPVPLPTGITNMAELRRVYNQNLQPYVDHMRAVFPVNIEETTIAGISAAIITPKSGIPEKNKNRLFLNGPGGGYRTGVRGNGLLISIPVAATLGVKVVSILYRQGPEYRFPAASEDMLKVWDYYTKTYKPQNIGIVGCSAGGSLASQTTAILISKGRPTPGVLGVYCSGLGGMGGDSQFYGALSVTNAPIGAAQGGGAGAMIPGRPAEPNYYTGVNMNQFIVNPTLDEKLLARFPPTIFFTGTRDFAMSSSLYSYRKLIKLGIDSEVMVFDGLYHGFMTNPDFPEAQEGYKIAAAFFDRHLGR